MFRSNGIGRARQQPSGLGGQGFVGWEADPRADRAQREAAAHVADVLLGQPEAGRPHEGATGRDDRPQPAGHTRVVPEQTVQGQETRHRPKTANTARQSEYCSRIITRNTTPAIQSHVSRTLNIPGVCDPKSV